MPEAVAFQSRPENETELRLNGRFSNGGEWCRLLACAHQFATDHKAMVVHESGYAGHQVDVRAAWAQLRVLRLQLPEGFVVHGQVILVYSESLGDPIKIRPTLALHDDVYFLPFSELVWDLG